LRVNEEDAKVLLPWFHLFGMIHLLQECDGILSLSPPKFLGDDLNDLDHQRSVVMEILVWADTATTYDLSDTLNATMKELNKAVNSFPEMITTEIVEKMRPFCSSASPKFLDVDMNNVDHQRSTMTEILVWAEIATTYDLSDTLDAMLNELKKAVNAFREIMTTEILEKMRPFWSSADDNTELWEAIKAMLPDDIKSNHIGNDAALKANKLLFEVVAQSCQVPSQIRTLKGEADFYAIVNLMKKYSSCPRI
jgi:gas vesicle protein